MPKCRSFAATTLAKRNAGLTNATAETDTCPAASTSSATIAPIEAPISATRPSAGPVLASQRSESRRKLVDGLPYRRPIQLQDCILEAESEEAVEASSREAGAAERQAKIGTPGIDGLKREGRRHSCLATRRVVH